MHLPKAYLLWCDITCHRMFQHGLDKFNQSYICCLT
uniref:Uncharacterized protein n=1 Tax=Arundo donax TaxID=35708 RepID=A0A0A9FI82_ARUDO